MTNYIPFDEIRKIADGYGETNDCTVIAVAQVCSVSYEKAHSVMRHLGRKPRKGFSMEKTLEAIRGFGFSCEEVKLYGNTVARLHIPRNDIFLIETSSHVFAARDGKSLDYTRGRRHRPLRFWKIEKKNESIFDHLPERVLGVCAARKQREFTYCCPHGCEFQLSTTLHNKILRGQLRRCKNHKAVIHRAGTVPSSNQRPKPSWIKES